MKTIDKKRFVMKFFWITIQQNIYKKIVITDTKILSKFI